MTQGEEENVPSCLVPNKARTAALVRDALMEAIVAESNTNTSNATAPSYSTPLLPLPVLNMGMPKCGSTTIYSYFDCIGLRASHWRKHTYDFEGLCMRDAVNAGLPPIATCASGTDAIMQMDVEFPFDWVPKQKNPYKLSKYRDECFFPQLSLLEEIHEEAPNATFVINFRPVADWVKSIQNWGNLMGRFQACNLPNLPIGSPKDLNNSIDVQDTMIEFFCSHVLHLRNFVDSHNSSHALIELDLYDSVGSLGVLSAMFPSYPGRPRPSQCWKHENKSKKPVQGAATPPVQNVTT